MAKYKLITLNNEESGFNDCLDKYNSIGDIIVKDINEKQIKDLENVGYERKLKVRIIDILHSVGMTRNKVGYDYVISGTLLLIKKGKVHRLEMIKLYKEIAKIYRKNPPSIESGFFL